MNGRAWNLKFGWICFFIAMKILRMTIFIGIITKKRGERTETWGGEKKGHMEIVGHTNYLSSGQRMQKREKKKIETLNPPNVDLEFVSRLFFIFILT